MTVARRLVLSSSAAVLLLGWAGTVIAQVPDDDLRYAAFRVVRAEPGEPAQPVITLPDGYALVPGDRYRASSRAEHYAFVQGPVSKTGILVTLRWAGESIAAVIGSNRRLDLDHDAGDRSAATFRLPVVASSPDADQSTIQVWSHMATAPGIRWRIEHNDPDRAAGPWTDVPWPAGEARAVIHYLVAAEAILRHAGLADAAAERGHFFALMGFETNNTLHPDNPPHWHLSYHAGETFAAPAYLPHFWVDPEGRTFYNGMDVTGQGRDAYRAGDPAPMHDFDGNRVLTTTIREDGGLDLETPGGDTYSIVPGTRGDFVHDIAVQHDRRPWLRIRAVDDVRTGVLVIRTTHEEEGRRATRVHTYDRLTGVLSGGRHTGRR